MTTPVLQSAPTVGDLIKALQNADPNSPWVAEKMSNGFCVVSFVAQEVGIATITNKR